MTRIKLLRWAGLAGLVSGVLLALLEIAYFTIFGDQPEKIAAATTAWLVLLDLSLLTAYLSLLALIGLYARQNEESGGWGFFGFILSSLAIVLNSGFLWAGLFVIPALASAAPDFLDQVEANPPGIVAAGFLITFGLFAIGWIVFGFASLRARVLPRTPTWLLMLGALLTLSGLFIDIPLGGIVFGAGLAWLGWWLWKDIQA